MLMIIFLILGIAAVGLHLFMAYVVPLFDRAEDTRLSGVQIFCGVLALLAIILAILVGFHVIEIPAALR